MYELPLDKKDVAILRELDKDVRASYAQIGRKTKLSKEVVQYRMKRLEEKGVITGYICSPKIGSEHKVYKFLIKNKSLSAKKKQEFLNFVKDHRTVSWLASTEGNWDFIITSVSENFTDFLRHVERVLERYGSHFKDRQFLQSTEFIALNEKYLHEDPTALRVERNDLLAPTIAVDEIDATLLSYLSGNARASFVELASVVQLTPEAVGQRFRKLDLLQGFGPRINHAKLGLEYYHIFIAMSDYGKKEALLNYYVHHKNCIFIMQHIGFYDLHLELVLPRGASQDFLDELTGTFGESIASYELLRIAKEHFLQVVR